MSAREQWKFVSYRRFDIHECQFIYFEERKEFLSKEQSTAKESSRNPVVCHCIQLSVFQKDLNFTVL